MYLCVKAYKILSTEYSVDNIYLYSLLDIIHDEAWPYDTRLQRVADVSN